MVGFWIGTSAEVSAETTGELFKAQCAGCHPNGANIIRRGKNLKQKALKRYGYESADAIATLITNGKGLMSAYSDRLSEDEIASLASYVLEQAAVNWKPAK
ncbi:MAG: c-type cytochrome [Leptolyngbyaceae cyanobacterium]